MSQPPRRALVIAAALAFLIGAALGGFWQLPLEWLAGGVAISVVMLVVQRNNQWWTLAGLVLCLLAAGWWRAESAQHLVSPATLDYYNDASEPVTLIGQVVAEPDRRSDHAKLTLAIDTIESKPITGKILIKTGLWPKYHYGDQLRVTGKIQTPFESAEFSYRDYLALWQIYSVSYYPQVELITSEQGNLGLTQLYAFKDFFGGKLNQIFPEPQASLMAGLLLGSRRGIPEAILEDFNITGLTHIIAISGYNIALIIALVTGVIGAWLPRRWQLPAVALLVSAFTLLVGAGAPVVRAAIMGLLSFYALQSGRQYDASIAIAVVAAGMVAWNPVILLNDVSFQLSFAAVLGLLCVSPRLAPWLARVPTTLGLRESLTLTLAAQITATPLIVFYFTRLSLIAPLANVLVAPLIPLAMLLGFVAVVLGVIFLPAGILVGWLAYGLLSTILAIATHLADLPGAAVVVSSFGQATAVAYYIGLIGWLGWSRNTEPVKKTLAAAKG